MYALMLLLKRNDKEAKEDIDGKSGRVNREGEI